MNKSIIILYLNLIECSWNCFKRPNTSSDQFRTKTRKSFPLSSSNQKSRSSFCTSFEKTLEITSDKEFETKHDEIIDMQVKFFKNFNNPEISIINHAFLLKLRMAKIATLLFYHGYTEEILNRHQVSKFLILDESLKGYEGNTVYHKLLELLYIGFDYLIYKSKRNETVKQEALPILYYYYNISVGISKIKLSNAHIRTICQSMKIFFQKLQLPVKLEDLFIT